MPKIPIKNTAGKYLFPSYRGVVTFDIGNFFKNKIFWDIVFSGKSKCCIYVRDIISGINNIIYRKDSMYIVYV